MDARDIRSKMSTPARARTNSNQRRGSARAPPQAPSEDDEVARLKAQLLASQAEVEALKADLAAAGHQRRHNKRAHVEEDEEEKDKEEEQEEEEEAEAEAEADAPDKVALQKLYESLCDRIALLEYVKHMDWREKKTTLREAHRSYEFLQEAEAVAVLKGLYRDDLRFFCSLLPAHMVLDDVLRYATFLREVSTFVPKEAAEGMLNAFRVRASSPKALLVLFLWLREHEHVDIAKVLDGTITDYLREQILDKMPDPDTQQLPEQPILPDPPRHPSTAIERRNMGLDRKITAWEEYTTAETKRTYPHRREARQGRALKALKDAYAAKQLSFYELLPGKRTMQPIVELATALYAADQQVGGGLIERVARTVVTPEDMRSLCDVVIDRKEPAAADEVNGFLDSVDARGKEKELLDKMCEAVIDPRLAKKDLFMLERDLVEAVAVFRALLIPSSNRQRKASVRQAVEALWQRLEKEVPLAVAELDSELRSPLVFPESIPSAHRNTMEAASVRLPAYLNEYHDEFIKAGVPRTELDAIAKLCADTVWRRGFQRR